VLFAALLLAVLAAVPSHAAAPPAARSAAAARSALPALPAGQPVDAALRALRRLGFRASVVKVGGYPKARPGHAFVATGLAVERRTPAGVGRRSAHVRYVTVRAGSRHPRRARIHVRVAQVRVRAPAAGTPAAAAPAAALAAAPATQDTAPQAPAVTTSSVAAPAANEPAAPVNAGATPVVAGPPPAELQAAPDAPAAPQGAPAPVAPPAPPAPQPTAPPAAAAVDLAGATTRFLRENTVHLPFMDGCTGFLVRDPSGTPIGAVSAIHCGLLPARAPRITGSDGVQYIVARGPLEVRNGEDVSSMTSVGTARSVTLPPAADNTHDLALITFADADADDAGDAGRVRAAYEAMRLSPAQVSSGRTVTLSAFPKAQPRNSGPMRRQVMTGTVLGPAPVYTTSGRTIPTVWTSMKANADGVVCSYGASGGAAVTADLVKAGGVSIPVFRLLGVLSGYDDFRAAPQNTVGYDGAKVLLERQSQTGFDLRDTDATCNYSHELPGSGSAQEVRLVTSEAQIPGR